MSKKEKEKQEIQEVHQAKPGSGKKKKLIMIALIVLVCCSIAAGAAFFFLKKGPVKLQYTKREYKSVVLPEEMLKYAFDVLPGVYQDLGKLNDEIDRMDVEIKRLQDIEDKYPKYKKFPTSEKKNIERLRRSAVSTIGKIEKEVEAAFVLSLVDEAKGRQYAKDKQAELEQMSKETLALVKAPEAPKPENTEEAPQGFLGKIKSIFKKKN